MPIAGKKQAKETVAKKPAGQAGGKSALVFRRALGASVPDRGPPRRRPRQTASSGRDPPTADPVGLPRRCVSRALRVGGGPASSRAPRTRVMAAGLPRLSG